ncbi:MAG: type II secretion system GspH family protein [Cephaloticoccus sp.]|nr:type II secretion system GspH family protein [Cephaloticoccus sp.]
MLHASRSKSSNWAGRHRGFTIVELAVTLSIMSVLSAVALPSIRHAYLVSRANVMANDLRVYTQGFQSYIQQEAAYPKDSGTKRMPTGMGNYLSASWLEQTAIGGYYNYEYNKRIKGTTYKVAIGIRSSGQNKVSKDADLLNAVDSALDDGNLKTGSFFIGVGNEPFYVIER